MRYTYYMARNTKIWFYEKGVKTITPLILMLITAFKGIASSAISITTTYAPGGNLFHCASADALRSLISLAQNLVLAAMIIVILMIAFMSLFASMSNILMHLYEFFGQRMSQIVWFLVFYIVMVWNLDAAVAEGPDGCGHLAVGCLLTRGPLLFVILGKAFSIFTNFTCNQ